MKIVEDYKQWKLNNPDEDYQYDCIHDFLDEQNGGDVQSLLEYIIELEDKIRRKN